MLRTAWKRAAFVALAGVSFASAVACQALLDFSSDGANGANAGDASNDANTRDALPADAAPEATCVGHAQSFVSGHPGDPSSPWGFHGDGGLSFGSDERGGFASVVATPEGSGFYLASEVPYAALQSWKIAANVKVVDDGARDVSILGLAAFSAGASTPRSLLEVHKSTDPGVTFTTELLADAGAQPANVLLSSASPANQWAVVTLEVIRRGNGVYESVLSVNGASHHLQGDFFAAADSDAPNIQLISFAGAAAGPIEGKPPASVQLREIAFEACVAPP